jgi:hypothetical protein
LASVTGHILGNRDFMHYNVTFQLHPVRLAMTFLRRAFYLFFDNFHWIGTTVIILAWKRTGIFRRSAWTVTAGVFLAQVFAVTVLGGAALERYLLPALPLYYIATGAALTALAPRLRHTALLAMTAGLVAMLFIPSPFPYPYENSLAMVDFIRLQKDAASLIESQHPDKTVASAWPFSDALRRPEFGYVSRSIVVRGLENFDPATVLKLKLEPVDILVLYSRTWEPNWGVVRFDFVQRFLADYYFYQPQITADEVESELGMTRVARFERRGQWAEVYVKPRTPNILVF